MKLKFKQQGYQSDATNAVVDCFIGQTKWHRKDIADRRIVDDNLLWKKIEVDEIFSNKKIEITEEKLLQNVREIQKDGWLPISKGLEWMNFTIEMETWTWKTYVYTKTMFELNKQYGWSKFIIMVPSVAIREWVHKSLQITSDHFQEIYGKKIRFTVYDTKNKSNLTNIKNFANTSNIEVIIMNYQAFATKSKESRKIYQKLDNLNSQKPIDIIKRSRPILIVDEPQRFWIWEKKESQAFKTIFKDKEFNQLFTLLYSATHKKDFNKIYRLDAIDAFNKKLVKKINVKWIEVIWNSWTNWYLFLDRINCSPKWYPTANIEFEVKQANWIKKVIRKFSEWDDLYALSNESHQYKEWYTIKEINWLTNIVSFVNWVSLSVWQTLWDVDEKHVRRIQIRETIKSHLEKERLMYKSWIKVLSLFFIDEVAKYRKYDDKWNQLKWEYEEMFEEEYKLAVSQLDLFDEDYNNYLRKHSVEEIHKWYFSIDKKWRFIDSKEKRWEDWSDDQDAYDLIMKNKEKLLSFSEPTRFIFSHSALREWWDNPNVFQICTLKHSQSTISKRQEIWRWLRICVNQDWERMDFVTLENNFFDFNTLTVIASESYDNFARELQNEILESLSDRPTKFTVDVIKNKVLKNKDWEKFIFDDMSAMNLIFEFKSKWYLDNEYKVTDKMILDIEKDDFQVTEELKDYKNELVEMIQWVYLTNNLKIANNEKEENINEAVLKPNSNFAKKEFQDLWSKINIKTTYEVDFNSEELIKNSIEHINAKLEVKKVIVNITTWSQWDSIDESSLKEWTSIKRLDRQTEQTENILWSIKYDLISELTKWTNLTRKTIIQILTWIHAEKFMQFKYNPESFISKVIWLINEQKATTLIKNVTYSKTTQVYNTDIFTINNFKWSLKENILEVEKHIYDYIKTDSKTERIFAWELESWNVSVYAKLPSWFKIPTPVWEYNPDWAIVFDSEDVKYIYFIAETKGSMSSLDLKWNESLKIDYARKHFESLNNSDVKYDVIHTYDDLIDKVFKG